MYQADTQEGHQIFVGTNNNHPIEVDTPLPVEEGSYGILVDDSRDCDWKLHLTLPPNSKAYAYACLESLTKTLNFERNGKPVKYRRLLALVVMFKGRWYDELAYEEMSGNPRCLIGIND